jgi:RNA polymerase sigma-70 factor (ECF subfamily)
VTGDVLDTTARCSPPTAAACSARAGRRGRRPGALLRAWRGSDRFQGRSQLGTWLLRIATNVCLDELSGGRRHGAPAMIDDVEDLPGDPDARGPEADPADVAVRSETLRLACVVALRCLPPRQRAVLVLCRVLRLRAGEAAELLGTSEASVNSALQRARASLLAADVAADAVDDVVDAPRRALLARYVAAFASSDVEALVGLALEEAGMVPPAPTALRPVPPTDAAPARLAA